MAGYPGETVKVVIGGRASTDIWRTHVDLAVSHGDFAPTAAQLNGLCGVVKGFANTMWTAWKQFNSSAVDYSFIAAYYYPAGSDTALSTGTSAVTPVVGTASGTAILPMRTCAVVSKLTNFAGNKARGRAYMPITGGSVLDIQGQMASGTLTTLCTAYEAFLSSIKTADLTAYSFTAQVPVVTGTSAVSGSYPITSLRMDSIPDTQRRRTNKDTASAFATVVLP